MKEQPNFTIVYVFGPMQCEDKYFNDDIISLKDNEWIKIGETSTKVNLDDLISDYDRVKDEAMPRVKNEPRTGIPFPSKIYDVFIFPYRPKTDDKIRNRLCHDLYEIDNSMQINKELRKEKHIIPSGQEFVYNVQRSKIKYAVQSIDHDLIAQEKDEEKLKQLIKMCQFNDINLNSDAEETEKEKEKGIRKANLDLDKVFENDENAIIVLRNGKGEEVVDTFGEKITAKYIGDNKFECRGDISRTSPLAKKYLNQYAGMNLTTVNGNEYWYYKGQKLSSLRKN
ncbi:MAG: hypothetical protein IKH86_12550 [Prevotella sp.]|nr:hypothetical protein [Prevotella sp.]